MNSVNVPLRHNSHWTIDPNAIPPAESVATRLLVQPDDELCLCFHVTQRKVANYIRIEKPRRVAQLSECYGAGTGCGWCRPFLERMFAAAQEGGAGNNVCNVELPEADDYACARGNYVRDGGGTPPPGATPPATESGDR